MISHDTRDGTNAYKHHAGDPRAGSSGQTIARRSRIDIKKPGRDTVTMNGNDARG